MQTLEPDNFTHASKKLFSLALPMAGIQLVSISSGFLCMAMLGNLGHEILAASALIFSTQMSIIMIGLSTLMSLSILVGHTYGAKNYSALGNYLQQGWTLGILISLPIMLIFWHMGDILIFFGQSESIAAIVEKFFHVYVWNVIPVHLSFCNQQFCYGIQKKKLVVFSAFCSAIILLTTAYLLIFGKFGSPALGVAGFAYAMLAQAMFFFNFYNLIFLSR